jgi:SulP family sulfate permease
MTAIDATGLQALEELADAVHASGRGLILCGAREQPARLMHKSEFEEHVGAGNISSSISVALERAKVLYQEIEQRNLHAVGEGASSTTAIR